MAPKPPPAKGPARAPANRPPNKLEQCLQSYNLATFGILVLFCLFLYTLWYISLCAVEKAKRDPLRYAVAQIRHYMISLNPDYYNLNDTDIILEAEKTSRELLVWAEKIKELQTEIADLHYKLNHDWMAHKGFLYLLSYEIHNYYNTIEMCKKHKGYIVDILDDHEEEYLEEMTKEKHGSYWIGLIYKGGTWRWEVSQAKSLKNYWHRGQPSSNNCGTMLTGCTTKLRCWATLYCTQSARGICKQRPEDKWIN